MKKLKNEYKSKLGLNSVEVDMLKDDIDIILSYREKINPETANILKWVYSVLDNLSTEEADSITLIVKGEKTPDGD